MRLVYAIVGSLALLFGGRAAAAPQLEYLVVGAPDAVAGIPGGRRAWELRDSLGSFFNYRIAANDQAGFRYKNDQWMVHNLTFDTRGVSLLLDWQPMAGRFRFSGGLFSYKQSLNYGVAPEVDEIIEYEYDFDPENFVDDVAEELWKRGINVEKEDLESYLPDDMAAQLIAINRYVEFDVDDLSAHARVKYEDIAPYLGFGWSTPFSRESPMRYSVDIGVLYRLEPRVDLVMRGTALENAEPEVRSWVDEWASEQRLRLHDKFERNSLVPRIGFGLSYKLY